jgi:hypothetical protein
MVTRSDYPSEIVNAALGVLVELMNLLGEYREHIILAGGWVPYFLFDQNEDPHCGSIDIDLALNFERITQKLMRHFSSDSTKAFMLRMKRALLSSGET